MNDQNYTTTFTVAQTPAEVFAAINDVRSWWSGDIEGPTDHLGDEFAYRYEDMHYSKQKITEFVPDKRVVWLVVDSSLNFVKDKSEWNGTEITFDVTEADGATNVRFTHVGLVPDYECFDACSNAWGFLINESLKNFITQGEGQPNASL